MGVYLNPSTKEFTDLTLKSTFVDQTDLLSIVAGKINDVEQKYILVSRPRRFGKTVTANMIVAFFERNCDKELFKNLNISRHKDIIEKHIGKYNVIKVDISKKIEKFATMESYADMLEKRIARELLRAFPLDDLDKDAALVDILEEIYAYQAEQFLIVIDEWDAPLRLR